MQPVPHKKSLADLNFLKLVKLDHLSPEEKQVRLEKLRRLAFLHFINIDLPELLAPQDLLELERMTANIHTINLPQVEEYLRGKIKNYEAILTEKLNHIKREALVHHYEMEKKELEKQQKSTRADHLVHILAIERLLKAVIMGNWDAVEAIIPQTSPLPQKSSA